MATHIARVFPINDEATTEIFICFLDKEINSKNNKKLLSNLRSTGYNLKEYDDADQCIDFISSLDEDDRVLLIVSGSVGEIVVPSIQDLPQIKAIYVYCINKAKNEEWSAAINKVKAVAVFDECLIDLIRYDTNDIVKERQRIQFNIYTIADEPDLPTVALNESFRNDLIIIDNLLRVEFNPTDKRALVKLCKTENINDRNQLAMIRQFKVGFKPHTALCWYLRRSFLNNMLNRALSVLDMHQLLLFRFVIKDIYEHIKENRYRTPIRVFHGEMMTADEIYYLKNSRNSYFSNTIFFMAGTNEATELELLKKSVNYISAGYYKTLFIIDADPRDPKRKSFVDISKFSSYIEETEILFMIGSVFRITNIEDEGGIYRIFLQLCSYDEPDLKPLVESMEHLEKDNSKHDAITLQMFGDLLFRMRKFNLAEIVYLRAINITTTRDARIAVLYCSMGNVNKEKGNYDAAFEWLEKALKNVPKLPIPNSRISGNICASIAEIYSRNSNYPMSLKYYVKAIEEYRRGHADDHPYVADFHSNMGCIYRKGQQCSLALKSYMKALRIDEKYLPESRQKLAKSHNHIALTYLICKEYDLSLKHNELSLEAKIDGLPFERISIAHIYRSLGALYEAKADYQEALIYYKNALHIHNALPEPNRKLIEEINRTIEKVLKKWT